MNNFKLSSYSRTRLQGVHPDLIRLVERAIEVTPIDFTVLEGVRTVARQRKLFDSGASHTMNSRHITGHAVDLGAWLDGRIAWDWPLYKKIAKAMYRAADELKIEIEWGGEWKMRDGPHFQLPWSRED